MFAPFTPQSGEVRLLVVIVNFDGFKLPD